MARRDESDAELDRDQPIEEKYSLDPWDRLHRLLTGSQFAGKLRRGSTGRTGRLKHTKGFINIAANGQVVDGGVHDHTIGIDDEQTAKCDTLSIVGTL